VDDGSSEKGREGPLWARKVTWERKVGMVSKVGRGKRGVWWAREERVVRDSAEQGPEAQEEGSQGT
jgi:hypothetical protein